MKTYPLWWLGFGIRPARSCWYDFRDRAGAYLDTLNATLLHQAVEAGLSTAERGALDGSAVAANASRRRLLNSERLEKRLQQLEAASEDDAQGEVPGEVPGWMAKTPSSRLQQRDRYEQAQGQLATRQALNSKKGDRFIFFKRKGTDLFFSDTRLGVHDSTGIRHRAP